MNMQALMRQAQSLQKDMEKIQKEIEEKEFEGESSIVKVKATGNKKIQSITIDKTAKLEPEDIEMLEDMIMIAINNTFEKVDKFKEEKLAKFGNVPGLF